MADPCPVLALYFLSELPETSVGQSIANPLIVRDDSTNNYAVDFEEPGTDWIWGPYMDQSGNVDWTIEECISGVGPFSAETVSLMLKTYEGGSRFEYIEVRRYLKC